MKTFKLPLYALTAILLVGLTASTLAQHMDQHMDMGVDSEEIQRIRAEALARMEAQQAAMRAMQRSPEMQQMQRNGMRQMMNSFWGGDGSNMMAMGFLQQEDFRAGIGLTDEQFQNIRSAPSRFMEDDPRAQQFRDEMNELMTRDGGPFGENGTAEMRQRFVELQMEVQATMQERMVEGMTNTINENLTPDQIQKVREAQISAMSALPIISASMFEALDLSDAQKRRLDEIKKEMEPEFERHADKLVDMQMLMMEKMQERQERIMGTTDPEERARLSEGFSPENIIRNNPELQRAMNEVMESGRVFSEAVKVRMFDVLTDAQWRRMTALIDNPPEYMKKVIAEMRKQMGTDDPQAANGQAVSRQPGSGWAPGPGSWQPGDPIPMQYRIERETRSRFPRGEE